MRVAVDIEANGLNPTQVWVICCKDIDTGALHVFRSPTTDEREKARFLATAERVDLWVGHNWLEYDYPVLNRLVGLDISDVAAVSIDTLILSRLIDYSRQGHSIEDYGIEFNLPKGEFDDWSKYSPEMEDYCKRDVEICYKIYQKYSRYIANPDHSASILLEHRFQLVVNALHSNGFCFNTVRANALREKVERELAALDKEILEAFPPRQVLVREFTPKATKYGTINRTTVPKCKWSSIHEYVVGNTYPLYTMKDFNPASHKQIIDILHDAGWCPTDKTSTAIDTQREIQKLKRTRVSAESEKSALDIALKELYTKEQSQEKYGWKINETNLHTLPASAPSPARTLARRILVESRRRTLTEWLSLVSTDNRVHGKFVGIGAWPHRMAHQKPNTANIPNATDIKGNTKLYGAEMRSLWCAPPKRLLVGVDAEGIQLRIFAHLIDDLEFTLALVQGRKDDKTDPHSLNQRIIGPLCKSRDAAKRFIYALLLGAGLGKLAEILGCSREEADEALSRILLRYTGFQYLKDEVIPKDARRGWFEGLDGRRVRIPGDTVGERRHLAMSGYLQNGESIVMKKATLKWHDLLKQDDAILVNFVHDEWQTECPNNMDIALKIARMQAESLREVGEELGLKCPLAGSYGTSYKNYTIGTNWKTTH